MQSKWILLTIICLVFFVSGCETAKGMGKGLKQDVKNTWKNMQEADDWIKKNLW